MSPAHPYIQPFLERLHGRGRLRVLSIVVSIFGDLVQPRRHPVSMQELLALTGYIGIEGGALRTAMSRLAKENWVERQRQGRSSFYTLSSGGEDTVLVAGERIYNPAFSSKDPCWIMAAYPGAAPSVEDNISNHLSLTKQIQVFSADDRDRIKDDDALVLRVQPENIPDWVREQLNPASLGEEYRELWSLLAPIHDGRESIVEMSPLEAIVLRVLLIHFWRRLILRHPLLPHGLVDEEWPGLKCHEALVQLYPALIAKSEDWWDCSTGATELKTLRSRFKSPEA